MKSSFLVPGFIITAAVVAGSTIACSSGSASADISAIRTEHLHRLDKVPLKGNAALYSGWTMDDEVEITMLYEDTSKPCAIDISKTALLVKYEVKGSHGKVFGWQLQPNSTDAGCLLGFASFRTSNEKEGHNE